MMGGAGDLSFQLVSQDTATMARRGRLNSPHGTVETPVFMPVGTQASVKGLLPVQLREAGVSMLLCNAYHLALRPGEGRVAQLGGLHSFMGWDGPILTDSGGFQVFSLPELREVSDEGVRFRSHVDGSWIPLGPERAVEIQEGLGADVILCLDECPPADAPPAAVAQAVARTTQWARRCHAAHRRTDQALFAVVQGGTDPALRRRSAQELVALDLPGYAVGGLGVGEPRDRMLETLEATVPLLPADRPRYLMGVGTPEELLEAVARGVDMFDCVMPTRNGRNATAFCRTGRLRLRNACYQTDPAPLESDCPCYTCRRFSRAYLRHLFQTEEMLGPILLSLHNVAFYCRLMGEVRASIEAGRFAEYRATALAALRQPS